LRALTNAHRAFATSHPGRYAATLRAPDPDDEEASAASQVVLETVQSVLAAYRRRAPMRSTPRGRSEPRCTGS